MENSEYSPANDSEKDNLDLSARKTTFNEYGEIVKTGGDPEHSPSVPDLEKIREAAQQLNHVEGTKNKSAEDMTDKEFRAAVENDDPIA